MFKSEIKGIKKVIKELEKFGDVAKKEIDLITQVTAQDIELDAKNRAPVDLGFLRNQIAVEKISESNYKIVANASYSAYQEFGTGGLVEVPKEMRDIAIKFKGNGVKKINIRPQPFMYPALIKNRPLYIKELNKLLDSLSKKI